MWGGHDSVICPVMDEEESHHQVTNVDENEDESIAIIIMSLSVSGE